MSVNYEFAHRQLRDFAFEKPEVVFAMLAQAEGLEALARVWNKLEELEASEARVAGADFSSYTKTGTDGRRLAVLKLPRAKSMCDVLFAALLSDPVRFFTLELTMRGPNLDREGNVLCEWKREGEGFGHANYGDELEAPTCEALAAAVERTVRGGG
ncbi:hypothetical protein EPO15_11110 [bacterium]|nr:MAG: hypothetical protein EPO15_11110 [bacterium]